jgi:hypothetical protein
MANGRASHKSGAGIWCKWRVVIVWNKCTRAHLFRGHIVANARNFKRGARRSVFCVRRERAGRVALRCELDVAEFRTGTSAGYDCPGGSRRPDRPHPLHAKMAGQDRVRYVETDHRAGAGACGRRDSPAGAGHSDDSRRFAAGCACRSQAKCPAGARAAAEAAGPGASSLSAPTNLDMGRRQSDGAVLVMELVTSAIFSPVTCSQPLARGS